MGRDSEEVSELDGVHELNTSSFAVDLMLFFRLDRDSLQAQFLSFFLSFHFLLIILPHTSLESLSALALSHMLDTNINLLLEDGATDLLVDDNSDGVLGHVVDASGLSVVELVRHGLVNTRVSHNVHVVSHLVVNHDLRERNGSGSAELLLEEISSSSLITFAVRHLY